MLYDIYGHLNSTQKMSGSKIKFTINRLVNDIKTQKSY